MRTYFRVYSSVRQPVAISHNIFSLFGNSEPEMTKALSFVIYKSAFFQAEFIKLLNFRIKEKLLINCDTVCEIFAEQYPDLTTQVRDRRDITLRFIYGNILDTLIVIEAKHPNVIVRNQSDIVSQLKKYFDCNNFSDVNRAVRKIGVTLTENLQILDDSESEFNVISLTWKDIFDLVWKGYRKHDDEFTKMYYEYLLEGKVMKLYKEEIFSPATDKTYNLIKELGIYCCQPNRTISTSLYLMPRVSFNNNEDLAKEKGVHIGKGKGICFELFEIENNFIVDENSIKNIQDIELRSKIIKWLEYDKNNVIDNGQEKKGVHSFQVFVLGKRMEFAKPKTTAKQNMSFQTYYKLSEVWGDVLPPKSEKKEKPTA